MDSYPFTKGNELKVVTGKSVTTNGIELKVVQTNNLYNYLAVYKKRGRT